MYGNSQNGGLPGTMPAGKRQQGIDPAELSEDERQSLKSFASSVASVTESYLPSGFYVNTMFMTGQGSLSLGVSVDGPNGSMVQLEIQPYPEENDGLDEEEKEKRNAENVEEISKQLAATAAYQTMQVAEHHGLDDQPAA